MAKKTPRSGPMRIGALAARTGISRETIHFYLREGLLPRPRKAARNTAFYDHSHVERLLLIKRLQNERFLPLSVIRRLLSGGRGGSAEDLDLRVQVATLADEALPPEELSEREIRRRTGLSAAELARAAALELVAPSARGGQTYYSAEDARVLELLGQAVHEAGYDFELAVQSFALYARHIAALERDEARLVFDRLLAAPNPIALVEALRRGREVQSRFLAATRARRLRREIDDYLGQIEHAVAVSGGASAFPLSDSMLARRGHAARVQRLEAEARTDPAAAAQLVALEYGVGRSAAELSVLAQRLRQRHGEQPELVLFQGLALVDAGEFEAGIALLGRACALAPGSALAHAALGSAHVRRARRMLLEAGAQAALREV
ncbi:MAG TPA: MerR family transcriptional regulator, partial [Polyangia bacterium]|nr:MerR family transcriptional regulator [Polyangia bacterium]